MKTRLEHARECADELGQLVLAGKLQKVDIEVLRKFLMEREGYPHTKGQMYEMEIDVLRYFLNKYAK